MDMNTMGTNGRGGYLASHRDKTLNNIHKQLLLQKAYGVYVPETNLSFKVLSDQTPHSNSKSPNMQGGGECSSSTAQDYSLWGCQGWFAAWHAKADQAKDQN